MLKTVNQKMNEILNLAAPPEDENTLVIPKSTEVVSSGNPDKDMQDDYAVMRVGMRGLIEKTAELVDNANFFAKEKQDARSVEAASMATKEARENLMALLNLHKTRKEIERVSTASPGGDTTITQNAVFVGTTGDLLKLTKDLNAGHVLSDALKTIDVQVDNRALNTSTTEED
jgi:methionyl-tRNA formyltransferase